MLFCLNSSTFLLLTSTWSQRLYFSHISAISCIGSKAPYTVVPAVAFTKRGTYPYSKNKNIKYKLKTLSKREEKKRKIIPETLSHFVT